MATKTKLPILEPLKPIAKCGVCGKVLFQHHRQSDCPRQGYPEEDGWASSIGVSRRFKKRECDECPLNGIGVFDQLKSKTKSKRPAAKKAR